MTLMNVPQAAKFLGKSPSALRNGYKRWGVPHFRLGGQIKFTQEALQDWIAKKMTQEPPVPLKKVGRPAQKRKR